MRLLLTGFVFLASLVAAVFVHAAKADAAWERPQQIDSGHRPQVRITGDGAFLAYGKGDRFSPSALVVSAGNEPLQRVRIPRGNRFPTFDLDGAGKLVALREHKPADRMRRRILAYDGGRWRTISKPGSTATDPTLAVAPSGAAVAAWMQYEESHVVVHAALRPPGGRFGPAQRLSGLTSRAGQLVRAAVDDQGTAVLTWLEAGDLVMARTVGASFTTPVRVHDRTSTVAGASAAAVAVRGERAVVAFTRLEDREPPEYRLSVATQIGDTAPVVETAAKNVSPLDIDAALDADGTPLALSAPIGPLYSLRLHRRAAAGWAETTSIPATEAPSTVDYEDGAVTWTEGTKGFAWFAGQTLALGRAYDPDASVSGGRAIVVWDRGPGRSMRLAAFTP